MNDELTLTGKLSVYYCPPALSDTVLMFVYKALHGLALQFIADLLHILYQDLSVHVINCFFLFCGPAEKRSSPPEQKFTDNLLTPLSLNMFISFFLQSLKKLRFYVLKFCSGAKFSAA